MIKKQDDYDNENVYIGSSCNFTRRKNKHKSTCYNENSRCYNLKLYQYIRQNGGWNSWCMTKIIDYPCNSKSELNTMERRYIDNYKSKLNCTIPTRTQKEWRDDNKEKLLQYNREWRDDNKEIIAQKSKEYRKDNKEKLVELKKQWRIDNKDKIVEQKKEWYNQNKDKILEKIKENEICDNCGCEVRKRNLLRHTRTIKCLNFQR